MKGKLMHYFTIIAYSSLYILVSIISMIHVVSFFGMSNNIVMASSLAIAFELGCAASLVSAVSKNKMNQVIVWGLFIILTCFQMMGNTFYAYSNLHDYNSWVELFGMIDLDAIEQKRYLAIISGAILPVVALGYIKCLVDYLTKYYEDKKIEDSDEKQEITVEEKSNDSENTEITEVAEEPKEEVVEEVEEDIKEVATDESGEVAEVPLVKEETEKVVEKHEPSQKKAKKNILSIKKNL